MRQLLCLAAFVFLTQLSTNVAADIEKVATPCDSGICFRWWPKLQPPTGWSHDRGSSLHYNFNALAPDSAPFSDAETIMYANALYRPRMPKVKTLEQLIAQDIEKFTSQIPDLHSTADASLQTLDKRTARTVKISPTTQGNWERVAYLEEGDFYVIFVISSRTQAGLAKNMASFEAMVSQYRE